MAKFLSFFLIITLSGICLGQNESAILSGRVTDPSGSPVVGAEVVLTNTETNVDFRTKTNGAGLYVFTGVHPGKYRVAAGATGFKVLIKEGLLLHVQDEIAENFALTLGTVSETVTVTAEATGVNTTDASVSTVVDRQFAENLPLNGRSFQTLIDLTPGVVVTAAGFSEQGQFSVNGQRADANYFTVDGVSANVGMSSATGTLAQSASGAVPGLSVLGGTNSLVPVDAMQEFRIQTSTYSAEFGRTPGAQVSIVTRSGTNQFHGAAFDYFRNDVLDANDWFANQNHLPRPAERQNDFAGVLGGPIRKDKTFFFFSYEGLRLRLPQTGITTVPSISARQSAPAPIQPFLNGFPIPNGSDLGNGQAGYSASFSNRASVDSYGVRIDHSFGSRANLFGRYSYSCSELVQRGGGMSTSLNSIDDINGVTQSVTLGTTWTVGAFLTNDLRFNYSRVSASDRQKMDDFGGAAVPPDSDLFVAPFSSRDSNFSFGTFSGQQLGWQLGKSANNVQRQINILDSVSSQRASHNIRFGVDYRLSSPQFNPSSYILGAFFSDVPSVLAGTPAYIQTGAQREGVVHFHNFSAFVQDTWKVRPRLTISYGLRWELNPPPSSGKSMPLLAVTGFGSLSTLGLAPLGTPIWKTTYGNFAPRVGLVYGVNQNRGHESVLRGGFGVFYDLATQEVGDAINSSTFPFGASRFTTNNPTFPLTPTEAQPPTISSTLPIFSVFSSDPNLKLPYTLQWNVTFEQALGAEQKISAAYVGAAGRRLLQQEFALAPNGNFGEAELVQNRATSDYNSFQFQFQRKLSHGLQALASYTWSHAIDTASSGSPGSQSSLSGFSDLFVRGLGPNAYRGPSDFDIRHSFGAALTYDIPAPRGNPWVRVVSNNWSIESIILVRSATPANIYDSAQFQLFGEFAAVRPDLVPGIPLYLYGPQYAGGKVINNTPNQGGPGCVGPFCPAPTDANGNALRQGLLGRNALRGFGATQWDFAFHREFSLREGFRLQFRSEFFNLLNHPNFADPAGDITSSFFGKPTQMLGRSLGKGAGFGGLAPLYQIGGPRSLQLSLELKF